MVADNQYRAGRLMASPSVPFWLLPFDRNADFVYASWPTGFTVGGNNPVIGEMVNKTDFTTRMLRAYYEKRWIRRAEEADLKHIKIVDRPFAPPPDDGEAAKENIIPFKRKRGRPKNTV